MKSLPFFSFFLFLNPLLLAQLVISNVALTPPSCHDKKDGLISLTIAGGTPPYSFLWSNQQKNQTCAQLGGGTYSVTVEDSSTPNKQSINATYILENPLPFYFTGTNLCHFEQFDTSFNYIMEDITIHNAIYPVLFEDIAYIKNNNINTVAKTIKTKEETYKETAYCCHWYTTNRFYGESDSIILRLTDSRGCSFKKKLALEPNYVKPYLHLKPDTIVLSSDQSIYPFIYTKASRPLDSLRDYQWYKDQKPYSAANDTLMITEPWTKVYTLRAKDKDGCLIADSVYVIYKDEKFAYAPNVFSPNGDTYNDLFYLNCTATVERIDFFKIYDRWGNLIFEQKNGTPNDSTLGWDGRYKGKPALEDTYVFLAQLTLRDGRKKMMSGDVLLMK